MRTCARIRLTMALGLAAVLGCTPRAETKRGEGPTELSPPSAAATATRVDAEAPPATESSPCRRDAEAGETATIPGLLAVEAPDGRSPSHGVSGLEAANFRLGNVTDRTLEVRASSLELRELDGASDGDGVRNGDGGRAGGSAAFAVASVTVDGVSQPISAAITVPPRSCVELVLTTDRAPVIRYHQRYAFVTTFSVERRSVVARSGDKYFRHPHGPKP